MNLQLIHKTRCILMAVAGMAGSILIQNASAGLILQDQTSGWGVFDSPYYKGQTFTAEDPFIHTIGIAIRSVNPSESDRRITMSLYRGHGISGPLLGARTVEPAGVPSGTLLWMDFDFSGIALIPGEIYSFSHTAPSRYWASDHNQWALPGSGSPLPGKVDYAGGEHFNSFSGFQPHADLRFRVVPVPEPSTVFLMAVGAGLVTVRAFRRKHK